jgi:hypothetical protein
MRISAFLSAAALIALPAGPAAAQDQSPPQSGIPIVVQGTRVGEQQLRDFVRAATNVPSTGQVGRFHEPVCPVAIGLLPAQTARVSERMRKVAAAAGMRVARSPCTPNIFVIVAQDKNAAIDEIVRHFPAYFGDMSPGEVRAITSAPGPAVAWQARSRLSADGEAVEKAAGSSFYRIRTSSNPSRIRSASMPTFVASIVVIDLQAAAGLTLTELADYAAMRTFAATDPDRILRTGAPTILGVLGQPDDRLLPLTLTHWDMAYLKALYSTDNAYYASYQRGDIEAAMKAQLEHSGATQPRQ